MASSSNRCAPVLVVDDDAAFSSLLAGALTGAGYGVVQAASGEEALATARLERPAAAVVDLRLPGISGYGVCHALRGQYGAAVAIILVSGERTEPYDRVGGLLVGADDYVVKPVAPDELVLRLSALLRRRPQGGARGGALTPREREVLSLLAAGLEAREIAGRLVISEKTVATHIERILGKLDVHSRAQAIALAFRDDLVSLSV